MLCSLHIENIAVAKSLDLDVGRGMTVLSGETGAGKSIIIDSLGLLSGAKADKELIRTGESRASVSALFEDVDKRVLKRAEEMGVSCEDGAMLLWRGLTHSGSSAKINGRAVTLSMLRELGGMLFNIHGQNDNQQLLDPKNHVDILDGFARLGELVGEYSERYAETVRLKGEIAALRRDAMERARLGDMLRFQIDEIDAQKLKVGEEAELEELVKKLRSLEKLSKCAALVEKALRGGERVSGAVYLCERAAGALEAVSDALPDAEVLAKRLDNIRYELEDIAESARDLADVGEGDPTARLDRAESRLAAISRLKKKYGGSEEEILAFRADAAKRLDNIDNAGEREEELAFDLARCEAEARELGERLSKARKDAARRLRTGVMETLAFLDMPKVRFEVDVSRSEALLPKGVDKVEFLIATGAGEPLMPMAKIASGGELARIMLSLKNVLNERDGVGTAVFDEIDTGISGKTSRKVGIKLKEIARSSQVLCVTHSAQIASLAHNHLYVSKAEEDGRVRTAVAVLDRQRRVEEISRILGGIEITEAVRAAALEMLTEGESYQ